MTVRSNSVGCTLLWVLACAEEPRPRGFSTGSGGSSIAGSRSTAEGGSAGTFSGNAGDSGSDSAGGSGDFGVGGQAGTGASEGGGAGQGGSSGAVDDPRPSIDDCPATIEPEELDALCDPAAEFRAATKVELASGVDAVSAASEFSGEVLVGITPDELSLVWSAAPGAELSFFLADRGSKEAPFKTIEELLESEPLGLSADGLTLVVSSNSRASLSERKRVARGESFGQPREGPFSEVNADARARGLSFDSVAVAPDHRTLYYTAFEPEPDKYPLRVSTRSDPNAPWPVGQTLSVCEFEAHEFLAPRPSAISADGLTLFYQDGARGTARAATRAGSDGEFVFFKNLGERSRPQPNLACDRLYYSDPNSRGIFFVSRVP